MRDHYFGKAVGKALALAMASLLCAVPVISMADPLDVRAAQKQYSALNTSQPTGTDQTAGSSQPAGTDQSTGSDQQPGTDQYTSPDQQPGTDQSTGSDRPDGTSQTTDTDPNPSSTQAAAEKTLSYSGTGFGVTLTYGASAGVPDGATLTAEAADASEYNAQTGTALNCIPSMMRYAKYLELHLTAGGQPVTPKDKVKIRVCLSDVGQLKENEVVKTVYYADSSAEPVIVEAQVSEGVLELPAPPVDDRNSNSATQGNSTDPNGTTQNNTNQDNTTQNNTTQNKTPQDNTTQDSTTPRDSTTNPYGGSDGRNDTAQQGSTTNDPTQQGGTTGRTSASETPAAQQIFGTIFEFETDSPAVYGFAIVPAKQNTYGEFVLSNASEDLDLSYNEEEGFLEIRGGSIRISSDENSSHTHRIVISGDAVVEIASLTITSPVYGAAITVEPGVTAEIVLGNGSYNELTGGDGYAGIEVGFDGEEGDSIGKVTFSGSGSLKAKGGRGSAGIGGSLNRTGKYGNIQFTSGDITAIGEEGAAGIGSAAGSEPSAEQSSDTAAVNLAYRASEPTGTTGAAEEAGAAEETNDAEDADVTEGANDTGADDTESTEDAEGDSDANDAVSGHAGQWGALIFEGGNITADGYGGGAGIGGGSHMDSGDIRIGGEAHIVHAKGREGGAGIGSGRGIEIAEGNSGLGAGRHYATVTMTGGTIDEAESDWLGAGIGGGIGADAYIEITGGVIRLTQGANGSDGALHRGGAGIGGGYLGHTQTTIREEAHIIKAVGGSGAPGIGNGSLASKESRDETETIPEGDSFVKIEGGTVDLAAGGQYGAGIGTGNGAEICNVTISGGTVNAVGYASTKREMSGGAGIGSGVGKAAGFTNGADTSVNVEITGGIVTATGGWGAAGIGSGALNKRAEQISVLADADIHAYCDGEKFALDTRDGTGKETKSDTSGRNLEGVYQGTFVQLAGGRFEGLTVAVTGMSGGEVMDEHKASLPEGYRSFAVSVDGFEGTDADDSYRVRAGSDLFASSYNETEIPGSFDQSGHRFYVGKDGFGDYYFLSPAVTMSATLVWVEEDGRTDKRQDVEISLLDGGGNVLTTQVIGKDADDGGAAIYKSFSTAENPSGTKPEAIQFPDPNLQEELLLGQTASADNALSLVFDDLVKYDASGENEIEYTIEETSIPQYRAAYVTGGTHMTITNTKDSCYLRIVSVNSIDSDQKIAGAVFKLEIRDEDGGYSPFTEDQALEEGQFTVESEEGYTVYDLVPGDYLLTEVSAPNGYKLLSDGITFTVNKDLSINAREVDAAIQDFGSRTLLIRNEAGSDLPIWQRPESRKYYVVIAAAVVAIITLLIAAGLARRRGR